MTTPLDPAELLRQLSAAGVDYVLIDGLAVNAHGVIRSTEDVDNAYATLAADARLAFAFGVEIRVCSLDALRVMKRAAGRPQDLQDLADLDIAHPERQWLAPVIADGRPPAVDPRGNTRGNIHPVKYVKSVHGTPQSGRFRRRQKH